MQRYTLKWTMWQSGWGPRVEWEFPNQEDPRIVRKFRRLCISSANIFTTVIIRNIKKIWWIVLARKKTAIASIPHKDSMLPVSSFVSHNDDSWKILSPNQEIA